MNKSVLRRFFFAGFPLALASFLFVFLVASFSSYCSKNSNKDKCLEIAFLSVPNDAPSQYMGSFMGAVLTFTAFYLLELIKKDSKPKPQLKFIFTKKDEQELLVISKPHYIFMPRTNEHREAGEAKYLRVKVMNVGNKMATGCIGVLKSIEIEHEENGLQIAPGWDGPMTLLWPYERHQEYRSMSTGIIPIGASDYLDILVAYDDALMIPSPSNDELRSQTRCWFLKLKTQPQPKKHRKLVTIKKDCNQKFYITLEVYAEASRPASITLVLEHKETCEVIDVYPVNRISDKIAIKLCSSSAMPIQPSSLEEAEELHNLL